MSFNIKKNIVPLKDGTNPIITLNDINITSDEYYEILKENSSFDILIDLIDNKLLESKYTFTDDELKKIKSGMNDTIAFYQNYYQVTEEEFLTSNGFKNKESFEKYLILEEKRGKYLEDYLKDKITDNELNNYYLSKMNNDFEIMYIKGDNDILEKILIDLNNGKKYDDIKKEYKNVEYKNLGYISFDDEEINDDIYQDANSLPDNTYTTSLRSINNEYYIIFRGNTREKDDIKNLKDRIRNKMVKEKIQADENNILKKESLLSLRKKNNLTFYDTNLENLYHIYEK